VKRIKGRIRRILRPTNQAPWEEVVAERSLLAAAPGADTPPRAPYVDT
jgi:hypothetical protein